MIKKIVLELCLFIIAEEVSKEYTPSARKGSEGGAGVTVKWK